ncbi:MAG: MBL fold metallo-hydrolase [Myxococcota bacterium]
MPAVQDALLERAVRARVGSSATDLLDASALRVLLCGSSSPLAAPGREKACVAVFAAGRIWIVDTGPGSFRNLALWRVPVARVGGVLLTHYHSDHIGELGELNMQTWVAGRSSPLRVFGPPGVERVVDGFSRAYALDRDYRVAHHGRDLLSPDTWRMQAMPIEIPAGAASAPVLEEQGLRIAAIRVDHRPVAPAYGYRFDYGGRSVVVSGDTTAGAGLEESARGVDVLVHEALSRTMIGTLERAMRQIGNARLTQLLSDLPSYHTTPVEAARVANAAGAKLLVLYHLAPPPRGLLSRIFVRGIDSVRPKGWLLGTDGLLVELPVGSESIETRSLR